MEAFVLDASVALSWCFPNDPAENTVYSRAVLRRIEEADVVVPEVWALEIANGIFVDLAAYDVAYIYSAKRENLPLATADAALKRAAFVEGIPLI